MEKISGELGDYASKYFMDCEQLIEKDLKTALENDILKGDIVEYYLECKEVWLRKEIIKVAEECP